MFIGECIVMFFNWFIYYGSFVYDAPKVVASCSHPHSFWLSKGILYNSYNILSICNLFIIAVVWWLHDNIMCYYYYYYYLSERERLFFWWEKITKRYWDLYRDKGVWFVDQKKGGMVSAFCFLTCRF